MLQFRAQCFGFWFFILLFAFDCFAFLNFWNKQICFSSFVFLDVLFIYMGSFRDKPSIWHSKITLFDIFFFFRFCFFLFFPHFCWSWKLYSSCWITWRNIEVFLLGHSEIFSFLLVHTNNQHIEWTTNILWIIMIWNLQRCSRLWSYIGASYIWNTIDIQHFRNPISRWCSITKDIH